ncbi:hypothetical protein GCM10027074_12130 [Streptomyces deserti]
MCQREGAVNWAGNHRRRSRETHGHHSSGSGPRALRRNLAQWRGNVRVAVSVGIHGTGARRAKRMTYDRLVCANCAAPVSEGRCPVCRANRERLQQENFFAGLNPMTLIALLVVLIAALALLAHQTA